MLAASTARLEGLLVTFVMLSLTHTFIIEHWHLILTTTRIVALICLPVTTTIKSDKKN